MENKTSFNLEGSIASWRSSVSTQEAIGVEQARELESHLREGVAGWVAKGLTEQEAFQVAAGRVGGAEKVAAEFAKEDPMAPWRLRLFWMLMGLITISAISSLLHLATTVPSIVAARVFFADEVLGATPASLLFKSGIHLAQFAILSMAPLILYFMSKRFLTSKENWTGKYARFWSSRIRFAVSVTVALTVLGTAQYAVMLIWSATETAGPNFPMRSLTFEGIFAMVIYPALLGGLAAVVAPGYGRIEAKKLKSFLRD